MKKEKLKDGLVYGALVIGSALWLFGSRSTLYILCASIGIALGGLRMCDWIGRGKGLDIIVFGILIATVVANLLCPQISAIQYLMAVFAIIGLFRLIIWTEAFGRRTL